MKRAKGPEPVVGLDVGTTKICAVIGRPKPGGGLDVIGVGLGPVARPAPRRGGQHRLHRGGDQAGGGRRRADGRRGRVRACGPAWPAATSARSTAAAWWPSRGASARSAPPTSSGRWTPRAPSTCRRTARSSTCCPRRFAVDDADGVREPIGMSGVRLEVEVHIVTAAVTSVQNVVRAVNRAGLTVQDVVLEPIASAEAVLFPDEKELGVVAHRHRRRHHRHGAVPRRRHLAHRHPAARRRSHHQRRRGRAAHADGRRRGSQEALRLRAHLDGAGRGDGRRAVGRRPQGAPALAPGAVGDHPAARRGDRHAGRARARRAPDSRTRPPPASW